MYNSEQFKNCLFNPTEKKLLEKYPSLSEVSNDEKLLRYVLALYDPNSPLIRNENDIKKRKYAAALFAGYNLEADEDTVTAIFSLKPAFKDEEGNVIGVDYLGVVYKFLTKYAFPREWYMICCNEQLFYEYGQRMLQPVDEQKTNIEKDFIGALADKEKLATAQESVAKRIDDLYKKMFYEEVDVEQVRKKRITPEMFSKPI